jgi:hypothetical protein
LISQYFYYFVLNRKIKIMKNIYTSLCLGLLLGAGITLFGQYMYQKVNKDNSFFTTDAGDKSKLDFVSDFPTPTQHSRAKKLMTTKFPNSEASCFEKGFRSKLTTADSLGGVFFPKTLTIEKTFIYTMLWDILGNEGGLILYPAIKGNEFTLCVSAARFPTDSDGHMEGDKIEVDYIGGDLAKGACYEALNPCPHQCPTDATDLHQHSQVCD